MLKDKIDDTDDIHVIISRFMRLKRKIIKIFNDRELCEIYDNFSKQTKIVNVYKDDYDVYIGRPIIYGNPYIIGIDGDRDKVINKFEIYFNNRIKTDHYYKKRVLLLKGLTLGCYCAPQKCHGDIYVNWLENL